LRVFIMRHGPAHEAGPAWPDDRLRPLTDAGRKDTKQAARGLRALDAGKEVRAVLSSPLVRARETAELAAAEIGFSGELRITEALAPGFAKKALAREIDAAAGGEGVLVVGHEPDMGEFVSWLLTGESGAVAVPMKKAAVACVEVGRSVSTRGRGTLLWLATPAMLRAIGRAE
jgi:phosphohistidine phosphatase